MDTRLAIFLQSGDYDRVHQGFSIAVTAATTGRQVEVFLFWWALERLLRDDLDAPDFGPGREEMAEEFVERGFPTIRQLLEAARASGRVRIFACTGSMAILGFTPPAVQDKVDELVGWSTILDRTAGVVDRFVL